jgi:CheY-like chemotaxis protein
MKTSPAGARILVATDSVDDARQVVEQLKDEFADVRASTVAKAAVQDFEACKPNVLVLAFDTLEKSQSYYLGLYRLSSGAIQQGHRTLVLCSKDEVRDAYELCKKEYFDDYVLYWPQSYDGTRLAMSIWIAARDAMAAHSQLPRPAELLVHAKHLAEVERVVADTAPGTLDDLRERIEPALAGTRPLARAVRNLKPLVLVVDDDEFARRLVQHALDPARWEVAFASNGAEALALLGRLRPDVILMDVRMPGLDGVALTRRLKSTEHLADIPIVMMTGEARRDTLLGSMEAGAVAFVVKPVSRAKLEAKLDLLVPR